MSTIETIILVLAILCGPIWIAIFAIGWLRLDNATQQFLVKNATLPKWKTLTWIISIVICFVFLFKAIF